MLSGQHPRGGWPQRGLQEAYGDATYAHRDAKRWAYRRLPSSLPLAYPGGYQPIETIGEDNFGVTIGLRGDRLAGWHWDLSTTYGGDHEGLGLYDTPNLGLYAATGTTPQKVRLGSYGNSQSTTNLDLRRAVSLGLASPLNIALGGEYRDETYAIAAGEAASYGYGDT